jgi:hypothetical protein
MMVEKECGIVKEPRFPPLWELNSDSRTTKMSVIDRCDKVYSEASDTLLIDIGIKLPAFARPLQPRHTVEYLLM